MSANVNNEALDQFGMLLVRRVRQNAIRDRTKILDGQMKGETADRLRPEIASLEPPALDLRRRLVPEIVDTERWPHSPVQPSPVR